MEKLEKLWGKYILALCEAEGSLFVYQLSNCKVIKKKENNSVYYFRERISIYSCDIVERRTNLMISTSHGLLNLQATTIGHIQVCYAAEIKKKAKCILIYCFIVEPTQSLT
jgi:hypothetical protein